MCCSKRYFAGLTFMLVLNVTESSAANRSDERLQELLMMLTDQLVGTIGIAAQRFDGREAVVVDGDIPFPMASTYKIPIAITLLRRVDNGEVSLEEMIEIRDQDVVIRQVVASAFPYSDAALSLAGRPMAVNQAMGELGVVSMSVDCSTAEILKEFYGTESGRCALGDAMALARSDSEKVNAPRLDFETDPLDKATPRPILLLLRKPAGGQALGPQTTDFLLGAMSRTVTKPERLGLLLPKGTSVSRKTDTIGGVANGVGYIGLPKGINLQSSFFQRVATRQLRAGSALAEVARITLRFKMR